MDKWEAYQLANENKVAYRCMNCGKDCDRWEIIDTGEAWERWCYCKECDMQTFHLIIEH